MIYFKSCPRCSGDRSLGRDHYGWYILCLICGYVSYPNVVMEPENRIEADRKAARA